MNLGILNEAQGYCDLQLWDEAWEATEKLAKHEKANPEVAALRLQISTELALWEEAETAAELIAESPTIELRRRAALHFLHRGREAYREGNLSEANRQIRQSLEKWPGIRQEFTTLDLEILQQD